MFPVPVEYSSPHGDGLDYLTTAAINYGTSGVPVFPCLNSEDKRPLTANGFKDATTNADQIEAWWRKWSSALIGLPTGNASGLFVIDIDVKHGNNGLETLAALEKEHGPLPETLTVRTWSGGEHRYFIYPRDIDLTKYKPLGNSSGRLGRGIDTRGEGGYVIVPPSQIDGKFYEYINFGVKPAPLPAWVLKILLRPLDDEKPTQAARPFNPVDDAHGGTPYGIKALEGIIDKTANAPKGERNINLFESAIRYGALQAGGELTDAGIGVLKQAALQTGLTLDEVEKTFKSGYEYGLKHPAKAPETAPRGRGRPPLELVHPKGQGTGTDGPAPDKAPALEESPSIAITEDYLALAFVGYHGQDWQFNHTDGQWYKFNGNLWRRDDTRQALTIIREICRSANNGKASLGKATTSRGVEVFAQADPTIAATSKKFDADDLLLGCPGGVVELESGIFRPGRREDFITMAAGTDPAASDECPLWKSFLYEVTKNDIDFTNYLQKMGGYCLSGLTTEHALFVLIGPGGNGKSVFENILRAVLGDYATTASFEVFAETRSEQHPAGLAALARKRLVTASEIESGQVFAESRIKAITGGEEISARFMRQNFFTFKPKFKAMIAANHRPALRNVDDAIKRRVKMIPFKFTPPVPDKNLEAKLKAELPAILRWMINGFLFWQLEGLNPPAAVNICTADYFEAEDTLGAWLSECCKTGAAWEDSASNLFNSWKSFRENRGEKPGTQKAFSGKLESRGFTRNRKKTGSVYEGLALK